MKSYNPDNISGITSTLLSSVALVLVLFLALFIKGLPEEIGLPVFLILFPTSIVLASVGVILGGLGLTSAKKPYHLFGLIAGSLAILVNLAVIV